jgi:hypothetical protein
MTFRWHPDECGAPVSELWLVASYLRRIAPDVLAIVHLEHDIGGVWSGVADSTSDRHRERASQLRDRIKETAEALGLDVRAGTHLGGQAGGHRRSR